MRAALAEIRLGPDQVVFRRSRRSMTRRSCSALEAQVVERVARAVALDQHHVGAVLVARGGDVGEISKRELRRPHASRTISPSAVTTITCFFAGRVSSSCSSLMVGVATM